MKGDSDMLEMVNGVTTHYEVKGQGETVLFLHGLGGSLNIWHNQVMHLSRYYQTVTFDLTGSGRTETTAAPYSMEKWGEELIALMDRLSIDKAHLVGHSMGTLIAQHFAVHYPERVSSLTLVGGIVEIAEAGKAGLEQRAKTVLEQGMDPVAEAICDAGLSAHTKATHTAVVGLIRELMQRNDPQGYAASCRALAAAPAIDHGSVQVPVLVIVGDEDRTAPVTVAKKLYQGFPNAKLVVVGESGHWTTLEKPVETTAAILQFLAEI
jgi:3-oxoadipate enol-lactonase